MPPTFAQLGVPDYIVRALARRDINRPFEIQAATIADALAGRDVCGRAPTGSGKTLAFGIPLVATVERAESRRPRGLVLAPTRELAEQINTELRTFAGQARIGVVYGGVGYGPQLDALRRGVEILVACPGRLEDLVEQGAVDLGAVDHVVLDEADRMADMGFMPAVRRILNQTSADRQTVLFSATLDGDVAKLTKQYQNDPVRHEVGEATPDIRSANHVFWNVEKSDRVNVTAAAVDAAWPAIVFCRTRHGADRLAKQLGRAGVDAAALHGGRTQNQRTRTLNSFTKGEVQALIATDVAARGIHVDGVAAVVHYDPPEDHKAYIHRSGRTARAGEGGLVVSMVQPEQVRDIKKMQRQLELEEPLTDPDENHLGNPTARTQKAPSNNAAKQAAGSGKRSSSKNRNSSHKRGSGSQRSKANGQGRKSRPKKQGAKNGSKNSSKNSSNNRRNGSAKSRSHNGRRKQSARR